MVHDEATAKIWNIKPAHDAKKYVLSSERHVLYV